MKDLMGGHGSHAGYQDVSTDYPDPPTVPTPANDQVPGTIPTFYNIKPEVPPMADYSDIPEPDPAMVSYVMGALMDLGCISSDTLVTVSRRGGASIAPVRLPLADLREGDRVRTTSATGELIWDEVLFKQDEPTTKVLRLQVQRADYEPYSEDAAGSSIVMTPSHLIYVASSRTGWAKTARADTVKPGDQVFQMQASGTLIPRMVQAITTDYLPVTFLITPSGNILANDFLASVHIVHHGFSHTVFMTVYSILPLSAWRHLGHAILDGPGFIFSACVSRVMTALEYTTGVPELGWSTELQVTSTPSSISSHSSSFGPSSLEAPSEFQITAGPSTLLCLALVCLGKSALRRLN